MTKHMTYLVLLLTVFTASLWYAPLANSQTINNPGGGSQEQSVETGTATMVNGTAIFTVSGGPVVILDLLAVCVTANDVTASTLQWSSTPTIGSATTFSGATTTLASATAGTTIRLAPTALSTAPVIATAAAGGVQLGTNVANNIIVKEGTITTVIGIGSTTGTWKFLLRYLPLSPNAVVR